MLRKTCFFLISLFLFAEEVPLWPYQVRLAHLEPEGVGFTRGYTSLRCFFLIPSFQDRLVSFFDLQGHVFNDGWYGANAGAGWRWRAASSCVFGLNFFYDYRRTSKKPYGQIGCGYEVLASTWDFRINGYLPIGSKRTPPFDFFFEAFPDTSFTLTAEREISMAGFNAEGGYYFPKVGPALFYTAFGPYCFHRGGVFGKTTAGGKLRLFTILWTYLELEGTLSYDPLFHWIGQGIAALCFPLGPRKKEFCSPLAPRFFQPVQRNEMIVLNRHREELR